MTLASDRDPGDHLGDRASARVGTPWRRSSALLLIAVNSRPDPEALARRQKSESFWGMSCRKIHLAVIRGKFGVPFQIPPRSAWHPWLPLRCHGIGREGSARNTRIARQRGE